MILRAFCFIKITCIQFEANDREVNAVPVPPNMDLLLEQMAQYLMKLNAGADGSPVFSSTSPPEPSIH